MESLGRLAALGRERPEHRAQPDSFVARGLPEQGIGYLVQGRQGLIFGRGLQPYGDALGSGLLEPRDQVPVVGLAEDPDVNRGHLTLVTNVGVIVSDGVELLHDDGTEATFGAVRHRHTA